MAKNKKWRIGVLAAVVGIGLAACGSEDTTPPPAASQLGSHSLTPANTAPTISGFPSLQITSGSVYLFQPLASDTDGDTLAFSATGLPGWAVINAQTGLLSGTPSAANAGTTADIVVSVSDGQATATLPTFRIVIASDEPLPGTSAPRNSPPAIAGSAPTAVQANMAYDFTPAASDPESQSLAFSIANKPTWASFSPSTGRLSGTPTSAYVGTFSNITISVSDGTQSASLPAFSITVSAAANRAPAITGTPSSSVLVGSAYSFRPTASDPDDNALTFSVSGKPAWATFSTATGQLAGTPTAAQAGLYSSIVISVSDGTLSRALPAFSIDVTQSTASGKATLSWSAPTQNTDGSEVSDLAGYRIYHGTNADNLNEMFQVPGASVTTYAFADLAPGTHYFAVAAYTTGGVESSLSAVGSKRIP